MPPLEDRSDGRVDLGPQLEIAPSHVEEGDVHARHQARMNSA